MFKVLVFLILNLFVFFHSNASTMAVPDNWILSKDVKSNREFKVSEKKLNKFSKHLDNIFKFQEELLNNVEGNSSSNFIGGWKFSSYRTYLGISRSGLLGIGSLSANIGTEITWKKRPKNENFVVSNDDEDSSTSTNQVNLNYNMSEKELEAKLEPFVIMATKSGRVKNKEKMRNNLKKKVLESHVLMKSIFSVGNYKASVKRFRIDLSFGVSGNIVPSVKFGAGFNLLVFWDKPIGRSSSGPSLKYIPSNKKEKKLHKMITKISKEVSRAFLEIEKKKLGLKGYHINNLSIGLGLGKGGEWGIAKASLMAQGVIIFKNTKYLKKNFISENKEHDEDTITIIEKENENSFRGGVFKIKTKKFRKGLIKALKIGQWVSRRAIKRTGNWYIPAFRMDYSMTYSGLFGWSGVSGQVSIEVFHEIDKA